MLDDLKLDVDLRGSISFFITQSVECPSCGQEIFLENIKMGGGRLDAGNLTNDLQRNYVHTEEHGAVFPLLYLTRTCNKCYFSVIKPDFEARLRKKTLERTRGETAIQQRKKILSGLYSEIPDFTQKKNLVTGLASYLLATATYNQFFSSESPHIRMAICTLRAAWICKYIGKYLKNKEDKEMIGGLEKVMYRKAYFLYGKALDLNNTSGELLEDIMNINFTGPDFDKDYGYDGVVYLHAWLFIHHATIFDPAERLGKLRQVRTNLSKVFGFGRASKEKPSVLLDIARETFDLIEKEMKKSEW